MKKVIFFALLALSMLGTSCAEWIDWSIDDDHSGSDHHQGISPCHSGDDIHLDSLPQAIRDYLNTEFANIEIDDVEVFYEEGLMRYGVRLGNSIEILFDENGLVISRGDDDDEYGIAIDSLLQDILDYVNDNFAGISIDSASIEIEYGNRYFEIELSNNVELYFDHLGNFICRDDSGHDDDDDDDDDDNSNSGGDDDNSNSGGNPNLGNLPDSIRAYLSSTFPNLRVESVEFEDLCDNSRVIEVELEGNGDQKVEVYFSLNWELLFVAQEISEEELPSAVLDGLATAYPDYTLEDDDIYQWNMADGSIQYSLEVETDEEDYDIIIQADGTILCVD